MNRVALFAVALMALVVTGVASPASAAPDLDVLFENTVKITSSSGEEFIYFNPNGTFSSTGPAGDSFGTWKQNGDQICTKTREAAESCGAFPANRVVGEKWENTLNGETVTIEIIKGR